MKRVIALSALLFCAAAHAVWLGAGILPDAASTEPISRFAVEHFVKCEVSGKPETCTVDFEETLPGHTANAEFVKHLNNSINLTPKIRRQLAGGIAKFQDVCDLDKMSMNILIAPMSALSGSQINVADDHRIAQFSIFDCRKPMPKSCSYCSCDQHDNGLDYGHLIDKIRDCHYALQDEIEKDRGRSKASTQSGQ